MDYNNIPFTLSCDALRGIPADGIGRSNLKLNVFDYLADVPANSDATDIVEVQFKNTRKGYYHNTYHLPLVKGDIVAVEATGGHDIGIVTVTGQLAYVQLQRAHVRFADDVKSIFRFARESDMEKYEEAKSLEHDTMIQSRQIAKDLNLQMKIGDVEYQGDGTKAIFYYIADGRVDFRQLIKVLADTFHVRIEMKQIGARQEAGRIGGTGPCGRELCCATWIRQFSSITTGVARWQDISINSQKLSGMCAKLKCCLIYEIDDYMEAAAKLPSKDISLLTQDDEYFYIKADILAGMVTYSPDKRTLAKAVTINAQRAFDIIEMNKQGNKPYSLLSDTKPNGMPPQKDVLATTDINRFDTKKKPKKHKPKPKRKEKQ